MNQIFWCAAIEGIRAKPKSLLYFPDGLLSFFVVSDVIYNNGYRQSWPSAKFYSNPIDEMFGGWALTVGTAIKIVTFLAAICTFWATLIA